MCQFKCEMRSMIYDFRIADLDNMSAPLRQFVYQSSDAMLHPARLEGGDRKAWQRVCIDAGYP